MTQPCPPSQSQSLLSDPEVSLRIGSRRKLLYSNGQPASEDGCTAETDLNRGESVLMYDILQSLWLQRTQLKVNVSKVNVSLLDIKHALYSQEQNEVEMESVTGIKSGKGKKEVLCWRCWTCPRLRKSTLRLQPAAQRSWSCIWTRSRFVLICRFVLF